MTIKELFNKKYDFYVGVATNILQSGKQDIEEAPALVNEAFIYLSEKKLLGTEQYMDSVVINWMNKQIKWSNTHFKNKIMLRNSELSSDHHISDEEYVEDDHEQKIKHIKQKYEQLDPIGRKLYDIAIRKGYDNSGKLSRFLGLNRTTCYYMLRDLRIFLKDGYE